MFLHSWLWVYWLCTHQDVSWLGCALSHLLPDSQAMIVSPRHQELFFPQLPCLPSLLRLRPSSLCWNVSFQLGWINLPSEITSITPVHSYCHTELPLSFSVISHWICEGIMFMFSCTWHCSEVWSIQVSIFDCFISWHPLRMYSENVFCIQQLFKT